MWQVISIPASNPDDPASYFAHNMTTDESVECRDSAEAKAECRRRNAGR